MHNDNEALLDCLYVNDVKCIFNRCTAVLVPVQKNVFGKLPVNNKRTILAATEAVGRLQWTECYQCSTVPHRN